MTVTISALTDADHDEWLRLWNGYLEFYEHSLSDDQTALTFARLIGDFPTYGALARRDGVAVGIVHWLPHASTWSDQPYCYLEDLFVDPDTRGSGIGRALIGHVTSWATAHNLPKVYWQTAVANTAARHLYDQLATSEFVVYDLELGD